MLLWLFFIWVSCLCSLLIDFTVTKIITGIVVLSFDAEAVLHVIAMAIGAAIPLGAISYMILYHLGEFSGVDSSLEGVSALLLQAVVALFLGFPTWVSGGVRWLAGLMEYGIRLYHIDQLDDLLLQNYLIAFLIFGAFYMAVKTCFGILGKKIRIRNRIELTGSAEKFTDHESNDME